jgi:hypothetical protein
MIFINIIKVLLYLRYSFTFWEKERRVEKW